MASVCIKTIWTISAKLRLTSDKRQGIWMLEICLKSWNTYVHTSMVSICWKQAKGLYCLSATTFFLNWCILEQIVVYPIEKSKKNLFFKKHIWQNLSIWHVHDFLWRLPECRWILCHQIRLFSGYDRYVVCKLMFYKFLRIFNLFPRWNKISF